MSIPTSTSIPPFAANGECEGKCARDRILVAAQHLFYRYGIRAVSVDAIAAEAGTTKVTLYRVFSSKDELVALCLKEQTRHFWTWWDAVIAPHAGKPRAQIEALFSLLQCEVCEKESERGCPIANSAVEIVDDEHPGKSIIREHANELSRRFRKLCQEMGAKRPDMLGDALTLLVNGVFGVRVVFDSTQQLQAVNETVRALLDSPTLGVPPT